MSKLDPATLKAVSVAFGRDYHTDSSGTTRFACECGSNCHRACTGTYCCDCGRGMSVIVRTPAVFPEDKPRAPKPKARKAGKRNG